MIKKYNYDCRFFSGYKPCQFKRACGGCTDYDKIAERIAILSLEAMGSVLRATCILEPIRRKYPHAEISWITLPMNFPFFENNPKIDRLIPLDALHEGTLDYLKFDILLATDKSISAGGWAQKIKAEKKLGFGIDDNGRIIPLNDEAQYQYEVGLDDQLKFFTNQKPETQQLTETLVLQWQRDPYLIYLSAEEKKWVAEQRKKIGTKFQGTIGFNTGCSMLFPYKKFTVEKSIELISMWRKKFPQHAVLLLGGKEDTERNIIMKKSFERDEGVFFTPTQEGLRRGILWMAVSDVVFSGDSLGLHMAIALEKPAIAWFGLSCPQEIDLYERGIKLLAKVNCSPCWKKSCQNEPKCFDEVSLLEIEEATHKILKF